MKITTRLIAPLAIAVGVYGCANQVVTAPALINPSYDPANLAYLVKEGPVYTHVIGTPYPGQEKAVDQILTKTFQETQITGHSISFTTDASRAGKSPYRLVVLFDPAPNANPNKMCEDGFETATPPTVSGSPEHVSMLVSFCNGERSDASIAGWAPATSPRSPGFKSLIQQASLELFSNRSIDRRGGNDFDN